jgi:hypothetical protein
MTSNYGLIPWTRVFFITESVQIDPVAHLAIYSVGNGGLLLMGKAAGEEARHSLPSSVKVKCE